MSHAEVNALTLASRKCGNWRLSGMTLYSTLEPCSMCAGAMILSRLTKVVWGAPDLRHGAHGSWVDLLDRPHPIHTVATSSGIYAEYSSLLLRRFFQQRRQAKRKQGDFHE
jgi:tRNA(adenine34) deaminase